MIRSGVGTYFGLLQRLADDASPRGSLLRAEDKAIVLFGMSAAIAIRRRLGLEPESLERLHADLLPFVVRSLTAPEGPQ